MLTLTPRRHCTIAVAAWLALALQPARALAQEPAPTSRAELIEQAKKEKNTALQPYTPNKLETAIDRAEDLFLSGRLHWHPFFESAYAGGGFTLGAGYRRFVSPYNTIDLRGSITFSGYKRIEAEFLAPRLFDRRGVLSVLGGWREATTVGFYGLGTGATSVDDRANYSFNQPYASAMLDVWPTRRLFVLRGGLEVSQWEQEAGGGSAPSVEEVYTPATLPGLGSLSTYVHTHGIVGIDSRPRRATRDAAASTASPLTTSPIPTTPTASRKSTTRPFSTSRCCAMPGCCRCARRVETTSRRRRARFRSSCCRRSAAGRRCAAFRAGASATATACCCRRNGASWSTGFSTRRCSTTPAR